jgi:hypothetical protein
LGLNLGRVDYRCRREKLSTNRELLRLIDTEVCEVVLNEFNMTLKANFNESNIQRRDDGCLPS